jgi:hypothetical protein
MDDIAPDDTMLEEDKKWEDFLNKKKPKHHFPVSPHRMNILKKHRALEPTYECESKDKYISLIFRCLAFYYRSAIENSEDHKDSVTISFVSSIALFLPWLTNDTVNGSQKERYNPLLILQKFETFRVNEVKVKPQSTGCREIIRYLDATLELKNNKLSIEETRYISNLTKGTKLSKIEPRVKDTLTKFFAEIPWLRQYTGHEIYSLLASPKRLMQSFSLTVANTLLYIQKAMIELEEFCIKNSIELDDVICTNGETGYEESLKLLNAFGKGRDSKHVTFLNLLFADLINPKLTNEVMGDFFNKCQIPEFYGDEQLRPTHKAQIFTTDIITKIVVRAKAIRNREEIIPPRITLLIESYWFGHLMAWLTVPKGDITGLTESDFRMLGNNKQREKVTPTHIYSDYFKSRAKGYHETDTVPISDVRGLAIFQYIKKRHKELDDTGKALAPIIHPTGTDFAISGAVARFHLVMLHPSIMQDTHKVLLNIKYEATPCFPLAIEALIKNAGMPMSSWKGKSKQNKKSEDYRKSVPNFTTFWYTPSQIKNSSVHSRFDTYSKGYLVNYNSHNRAMEDKYQIDESNKEYTNMNGPTCRLVMDDLASNLFISFDIGSAEYEQQEKQKELLELASERIGQEADDLYRRTTLVTGAKDGRIIPIHATDEHNQPAYEITDKIIVINSVSTVIVFLHYIEQVERNYLRLLGANPEFLELTALPTCEYYERMLSKQGKKGLSQDIVAEGKTEYLKVAKVLPTLFVNEIKG